MEKEKRTDRLHMKIQPSLKAEAEKKAEEQGYTLSRYVEMLIRKDIEKSLHE